MAICLKLLRHWMRLAFSLAFARAGNNMAARMAIMAMTTSSSIRVKPPLRAVTIKLYEPEAGPALFACGKGCLSFPLKLPLEISGTATFIFFSGIQPADRQLTCCRQFFGGSNQGFILKVAY